MLLASAIRFNEAAIWGSRKSADEADKQRRVIELQGGRDLVIAEIPRKEFPMEQAVTLQGGRDLVIAEIAHPDLTLKQLLELQGGRDLVIAEICPIYDHGCGPFRFNEAAIWGSRKFVFVTGKRRQASRFNEAAIWGSRKSGNVSQLASVSASLQGGRDLVIAEMSWFTREGVPKVKLQGGRDLVIAEIFYRTGIQCTFLNRFNEAAIWGSRK